MSHRLELESTFRRIYILVTFCFFFPSFLIPFFFLSLSLSSCIAQQHCKFFYNSDVLFSLSSSLSLSFLLPCLCIYAHPPRFVASRSIRARACNVESIRCDAFGAHTRSLLSCLHSLFSTCHCHRHVRLRANVKEPTSFQLAETRANLP